MEWDCHLIIFLKANIHWDNHIFNYVVRHTPQFISFSGKGFKDSLWKKKSRKIVFEALIFLFSCSWCFKEVSFFSHPSEFDG